MNSTTSSLWQTWLNEHWSRLVVGAHVDVPYWMPHPRFAGFRLLEIAEPAGQVADWAFSVQQDRSRIHIHEFADGTFKAHRDQFDPEADALNALGHFVFESKTGGAVTIGAIIGLTLAVLGGDGA